METSVLEQSFGKKLDKQMFENYNTDINKERTAQSII